MAGAKETPRQKMIGMMYLVLTALLALNISKEVLNGFVKVENSLISTLNAIANKGDQTHATLFAKYIANEEKVKPFYDQAETLKSDADSLVAYIYQLKGRCLMSSINKDRNDDKVVDLSDYLGKDNTGRDTVLNLNHVEIKDEYHNLTNFMIPRPLKVLKVQKVVGNTDTFVLDITGDDSKLEEVPARDLKQALKNYRDQLININVIASDGSVRTLPDYLKTAIMEKFSFADSKNADNESVSWEVSNFYDVPLAAVMPLMSKMIIDVEDAEAEVLTWLLDQIESKSLKFSEVKPMVYPQSNYIIRGDTISAEIFLAAFDPTRESQVYIETEKWDGVDTSDVDYESLEALELNTYGEGLFRLGTKSMNMGQYSYRGVIRYQGPDGNMQSQNFTTPTFTIAEAALVVSPVKMNVFYRGLNNPVKISVPGVANDKLKVSISSGHTIKKQSDGSYNVKPSSSTSNREAIITVKGEMPDGSIAHLGTSDFRIKPIPDPDAFWSGKGGDNTDIRKSEVLAFNGLGAKMIDFDFDMKVPVKSFTLLLTRNGTTLPLISKNNQLTSEMKEALGRVKKGNRITFDDIIVRSPDGDKRISSLTLTVTN